MDPTLREYYQWIQVLAYYLQAETWPFTEQEITQTDAKTQIVIAAQSLGLDPRDEDIFIKIINKIDELLIGQAEVLDTSQLDVVKIRGLVEEYEKYLASVQERDLKSTFPTVDRQVRANQRKYAELLRNQLAAIDERFEAKVDKKPTILAEVASWDIALENSFALPRMAREEALKKEEYEGAFVQNKPVVKKVLAYAAVKNPETTAETFIKEATKEIPSVVKEVAVTSRYLVKEVPLPPPPKFAPEDLVLPEKIAEELAAKPGGVSFLSAYALLEPRVAGAWAQRAVLFLPTKVIQASADEATPEWQEMMRGVFVEDIEASIARLKELGLSEKHPMMISLKDKAARLREQQKIKIIKDKETIYKDTLAARVLKGYHRFSKLTGQQQVFLEEIKAHLPRLSPAPIWTRGGYPALLRRGLNKFGFITRLYKEAKIGPYKTVVRPYLSRKFMEFITRHRFSSVSQLLGGIYQKTLGPIFSTLAKTGLGKAVKSGIKKAATWVATKLGVQASVTAAGIAAAGPTAGVSLLVSAAINLALEVGGKILRTIWDKIKSVFREPEKALAVLGVGAVAAFFLPMPIALVAVAPIVIGGLGLISWGAASAGTILGGFAAKATAFFVILTTAPITAPIALLVLVIIGILATTTFFIVMTTAGAFVLPIGPIAMVEEYPPPVEPPVIEPPPELVFSWPTAPGTGCTSNFGYRPSPFGNCCEYHEGIDIGAACGAPVYATADGVVTDVDYNSGYGIYIIIKHSNNLYSFYAHLDDTNVGEGQEVEKSDLIGWVGNTGRRTGCHLHFSFSECDDVPSCFNNGVYTPDPCDYVPCPSGCGYRNKEEGCQGLPLCRTQ